MHLRVFTIIILLAPLAINAQAWTSPDGVVTVTTPDPNVFTEVVPPPSPFIVVWASNDDTQRLGVTMVQMPPGTHLIQDAVEEGMGERTGGQITRLPSRYISGHEVWIMRSSSPSETMFQAVFEHHGTAYKIMSATPAGSNSHTAFDNLLGSASLPLAAKPGPQNSAQNQDDRITLRTISKKLGGIALLVLIIAGIIKWEQKKNEQQATDVRDLASRPPGTNGDQ